MSECCRNTLEGRPAMPQIWLFCPGCGERWETRGGQWIIVPTEKR